MELDVRAALDKFRGGEEEAAFFALLEIPGDVLPALIDAFRIETDAAIRALLVRAAWDRRDHSALPFLGEALSELQEQVWQQALDGLVAFASPESLEILRRARHRDCADDAAAKRFRLWLEEAIQQVEFELHR
jgi:hypothetical protein